VTGKQYADRIASYIVANFGTRGLKVYREVTLGKTVIGKNRKVDLFIVHEPSNAAVAIECKYQEGQGTVDEKIPYALDDIEAMPVPGYIVYAGEGFSRGVVHMLEASRFAARCLPDPSLVRSSQTWELDHVLALRFSWWDVILSARVPHSADSA
jgi:hypothetical protein